MVVGEYTEKEIKVGQSVYLSNRNYKKGRELKKDVVSKIGNKLILLESGLSFYMKDGQERSDYCRNQIYSCNLGFEREAVKKDMQLKIRNKVYGLSYEKCLKIIEIIEE